MLCKCASNYWSEKNHFSRVSWKLIKVFCMSPLTWEIKKNIAFLIFNSCVPKSTFNQFILTLQPVHGMESTWRNASRTCCQILEAGETITASGNQPCYGKVVCNQYYVYTWFNLSTKSENSLVLKELLALYSSNMAKTSLPRLHRFSASLLCKQYSFLLHVSTGRVQRHRSILFYSSW